MKKIEYGLDDGWRLVTLYQTHEIVSIENAWIKYKISGINHNMIKTNWDGADEEPKNPGFQFDVFLYKQTES